jgi:hypothetical protein
MLAALKFFDTFFLNSSLKRKVKCLIYFYAFAKIYMIIITFRLLRYRVESYQIVEVKYTLSANGGIFYG